VLPLIHPNHPDIMAAKTAQLVYVSNIATQRKNAGMTQRELAIALEMTEASVQNWESGRAGVTHLQRIVALCDLLDCPVESLVEIVPAATDDAEITYISHIKACRKARGLKQRQVALSLQITERTVKAWEKGDMGLEAIAKIIQLCDIFQCPIQDLIQPLKSKATK
jgi:transcriptional regulator with XRE-family HTH domain